MVTIYEKCKITIYTEEGKDRSLQEIFNVNLAAAKLLCTQSMENNVDHSACRTRHDNFFVVVAVLAERTVMESKVSFLSYGCTLKSDFVTV